MSKALYHMFVNMVIFIFLFQAILNYAGIILDSFCFKSFQGDKQGAKQELLRCLQAYGIAPPTSQMELFIGFCWQLFRQIMHRLWIGRWLSRHAGGILLDG